MATRLAVPAILVVALAIRVPFAFLDPVVIVDPHIIAGWATTLASGGMPALVQRTPIVLYPPLAMLALWVVGVLGQPLVGLRLIGIFGDVGLAALVALLLADRRPRVRIAIVAAVAFNPALWYISAVWGQLDSVYALLGAASLGWLALRQTRAAAAAAALSIAWKLQALVLAPVVAAVVLRDRRVSSVASAVLVGAIALAVPSLLLLLAVGFDPRYLHQLWPPTADLNVSAFNIWYLATLALHDAHPEALATLSSGPGDMMGVAAVAAVTAVVCVALLRVRDHPSLPLLSLAGATLTLAAFVFLTGMHERYLIAAVPLLALAAAGTATGQPDRAAIAAFIAITLTQTLNLLAVGSLARNLWRNIFAAPTGPLAQTFVALGVVSAIVNVGVLAWCVWRFTALGWFPASTSLALDAGPQDAGATAKN